MTHSTSQVIFSSKKFTIVNIVEHLNYPLIHIPDGNSLVNVCLQMFSFLKIKLTINRKIS
jgi:hypothetical protein